MDQIHRKLHRYACWNSFLKNNLLPWALDNIFLGNHLLEIGPGPGLITEILLGKLKH